MNPQKLEPYFARDLKYIPHECKIDDGRSEEELVSIRKKYHRALHAIETTNEVDAPSAKFLAGERYKDGCVGFHVSLCLWR